MILQVSEVILVLLLSIIIVLVVPKVREITNKKVKTTIYLFLGLILFVLVGMSYNVIRDMNTGPLANASDPWAMLNPYTNFFPPMVLAIALAGVVLVTYMEGDIYGLILAGTGAAVVLPNIVNFIQNGRFDLFLLGFVAWALIPIVWVVLFRRLVYADSTMRERIWAAASAALISYLVYLSTAFVTVFNVADNSKTMSTLVANSNQLLQFVVMSLWFFILLTVIIVSLMFVVHDITLHTFNIQRIVKKRENKREIEYRSMNPVEEIVNEITPRADAYKGLVEELQVFQQYLDQVDRIRAASTIARFKQEYVTLAARHSEGSKAEAEHLIKAVEQEFKKRY